MISFNFDNDVRTILAFVLLNLISLWVDSENNRRITLLALSFLGHLLYMQHLFWVMPHNGDTVPDLCKGFGKIHSIFIFLYA